MAKIDIQKAELVWPGKKNEDGTLIEVPRVSLPFQIIESVNESRATREAKKSTSLELFQTYHGNEGETFETGWRNKLIWGDNQLVLGSLLEKFAGKIDLIYIDPPFATGSDFSFKTEIGDSEIEINKEQSILEEKAYRDTWGRGNASFLDMLVKRLILMRDLLSPTGNIFIHLDWRVGSHVKIMLDEIFGESNFRNEIIWHYRTGNLAKKQFQRKHDNIFFYSKSANNYFNPLETKEYYEDLYGPNFKPSFEGRKQGKDEKGIYRIATVDDVWDISAVFTLSNEHLPYDTQKPEALLRRIIESSCPKGGVVADFFSGSGTTMAVAEKMNCRWIGCDLGRFAIHTTRKRLLEIPDCKPFEILNLGRYERQYWQGMAFAGNGNKVTEKALYEYFSFVLRLYGSQPISGMKFIHGKKGKALVHVGTVDAPITFEEVNNAMDECISMKQSELHILGWEWEMGLAGPNNGVRKGGPMHDIAKQKGVKLILLEIPREVMEQQAVDKNDIKFFELAYLEVEILSPKKLTAQIKLKNFVIPNTELIPDEVRSKIKKWSDYIDYWAVDWNFQNDAFIQGWVTYRTPKDRTLALASDKYEYEKPGKYRVLIKVVDIFGNDTSQAYDVEIK